MIDLRPIYCPRCETVVLRVPPGYESYTFVIQHVEGQHLWIAMSPVAVWPFPEEER